MILPPNLKQNDKYLQIPTIKTQSLMKKILLLTAMLLAFVLPTMAKDYEFTMRNMTFTGAGSATMTSKWGDLFNVTILKNDGPTPPNYYSAGDVRIYAKGTITIKSDVPMTKLDFALSTNGKKRLPAITPSEGTIATQAYGDEYVIWTGDATEVTLTVGDKSEYGTDGATKAGQFNFTNVIITVSDVAVNVLSPEFSVPGGVVDAGTEVAITCATEGASIYYTTDGSTPTNASTLYTGAITINETTTINAIAYKGADKSSVTTATYTILEKVATIAAAMEKANNVEFIYTGDLTVVYHNGSSIYVYDGINYTLLYDYNFACEAGDVLKGGWRALVSIYNGLFELKLNTVPTIDGKAAVPAPVEITSANIAELYVPANVNGYYLIKNVTFAEATPAEKANQTVNVGETSVLFRNNFAIASVEAGTYDVLGFISVYEKGKTEICTAQSTLQFFPIEYKEVKTDGIEGVEADSDAPVEYYNLSGIRVSNPAAGQALIRVQAGKASKIRF